MTLSIPAACIDTLGGLVETDAPVLYAFGRGGPPMAHHPSSHSPPLSTTSGWLLLPQSAPALFQVLARHAGVTLAEDEVPAWTGSGEWAEDDVTWEPDGHWWLSAIESQALFGPEDRAKTPLTPEMSRMRALAEAVVWSARVKRLGKGYADRTEWQGDLYTLQRQEHVRELPVWEVTDG